MTHHFTPNKAQKAIIALLERKGVQHPTEVLLAAERAGAKLSECVATLFNETSGGINEFGHDPGNPVQGGTVTAARYREMRGYVSKGYPSQGVGPCQLTSTGLQDEADRAGGCWKPYPNMLVGFRFHQSLGDSAWSRFYHYNGSGPMAAAYATRAVALSALWSKRIKRAIRKAR